MPDRSKHPRMPDRSKQQPTKVLRGYQSNLIRFMFEGFERDERKSALIAATGAGKSLLVTTLLERLRKADLFRFAVVAVPQSHIKQSFGFAGRVLDQGDGTRTVRTKTDDTSSTCTVDLTAKTTAYFARQLAGRGDTYAYVCTHATVASSAAREVVRQHGDLNGALLVLDEGHRSTSDKDANQLSKLRDLWIGQGGAVLIVTATPYRTDGTSVIDDSWFRVSRSNGRQREGAGTHPMITLKGAFGPTADRAINRQVLREELLGRYEAAAKEGPGMGFTCRRCLKRCDEGEGSDFLAGLCDACSNEVEDRLCRRPR